MPTPYPTELLATFQAMAKVIYAGESYESVHESLCAAAVELVDGCDHASLMLRRNGRTFTAAATDETARVIDGLETTLGEGPCIDAIDDDEPDQHLCADLATGCKWPTLADRIVSETGVRGMAGFRIRQEGQKVGALNLFSDRADAFDDHSLEQALVLSAFASVALAALDRGEEATTLRRGLESNREIGKAVGLLMAMHKIDDERAFEMLAKVSQEMNIKVAEVANQVIQHHRRSGDPSPA
jgi:transcriptional regulator with GAF, ATPase, and Fis domain